MHEHVSKHFQRMQILGTALVRRKRDALERYKEATDVEYNKEASTSTLAWFSLALTLVPEAAALLGAFKVLAKGTRYYEEIKEAADLIGGVKDVNEAAKKSIEIYKGTKEVGEASDKQRATSEAEARGNYIMFQVDNLTKLEEEQITALWQAEDILTPQLDARLDAGASLDAFLADKLPIPTEVPTAAGELVSYRFELLLYKDHFSEIGLRKRRTASYLDPEMSGEGTFAQYLEEFDIPPKLLKRIKNVIGPKVPEAVEVVFGEHYEATPARQEKRSKEAAERKEQSKKGADKRWFDRQFRGGGAEPEALPGQALGPGH